MKRMHVGLKVEDLDEAIAFYTRLFAAEPSFRRDGYAKWMLDDPRVNFSVDTHGDEPPGATMMPGCCKRRRNAAVVSDMI